jgi:hypothetical protein
LGDLVAGAGLPDPWRDEDYWPRYEEPWTPSETGAGSAGRRSTMRDAIYAGLCLGALVMVISLGIVGLHIFGP